MHPKTMTEAQRVRYTLAPDCNGLDPAEHTALVGPAPTVYVGEGWGYIDGPWFHVLDAEHNRWTTYPQHSLIQIEWQA